MLSGMLLWSSLLSAAYDVFTFCSVSIIGMKAHLWSSKLCANYGQAMQNCSQAMQSNSHAKYA